MDGNMVENYYKPARFEDLFLKNRTQAIIDIELLEMNSQQTYLYVLYHSDFDKAVGTMSR